MMSSKTIKTMCAAVVLGCGLIASASNAFAGPSRSASTTSSKASEHASKDTKDTTRGTYMNGKKTSNPK